MRPLFQVRNRYLLAADIFLIITAVLASFALRLDVGPVFTFYLPSALQMVAIAIIIKPAIYYLFGMYRRYWVYASVRELRLIFIATITASAAVGLTVVVVRALGGFAVGFPRSVIGIDWLLSLFSVGGLRVIIRLLAENGQISQKADSFQQNRRVVIAGAGDAGVLVLREMQRNPQLNMIPVAFVDDDPEKKGMEIHGVKVMGGLADVDDVVARTFADEVVIAIPTAPGPVVRLLTEECRAKGIPFRTMPGIYELIGGKVSVNRLRDVDISDLLRREPAEIDDEAVGRAITGRRVMITGAGGSIGLEICRQVARWNPNQLIILGHGENSIFDALIELRQDFPGLSINPVIADIRDVERVSDVFDNLHPEVVFHAAAHKHVSLMEVNVEEAVTNNVLGTKNVVEAAIASGTERFVFISTDKAVQPSSVMGATKRVAEMIVRDAAQRTGRAFVTVRFGNVLGSRGSIVPIFKHQIAQGGPITITHPEMKRFFMTIPEAVHLVLQSASMGQGGDLFVLKMGEQIRIVDLAEDLIRLSGLEPGRDIHIQFTGIRPGEKLSEALWDEELDYSDTPHPDIVRVETNGIMAGVSLQVTIDELMRLAMEGDGQAIVGLLDERVPGSMLRHSPPPDLTTVI
ncbi:MAG: nucleoside-diphosphate sugar epimerase/dehydratase [Anaerolineales bacterium]|jgi:FlaA1/EpsC-like NDP-sugar epimerase